MMITVLSHQQLNLRTCRWHLTLLCQVVSTLQCQCQQATSSVMAQVSVHCLVSVSTTDVNSLCRRYMATRDIVVLTLYWQKLFLTCRRLSTQTSCMPPGLVSCFCRVMWSLNALWLQDTINIQTPMVPSDFPTKTLDI